MGWIQKIIYGVDLDEQQRIMDETDAKLLAENKRLLESGYWNQQTYEQSNKQIADSYIPAAATVSQTFRDEVGANIGKGADAINSTLTATLSTLFRAVPWWLWLAAIVFVAWPYLLPLIRRRLAA